MRKATESTSGDRSQPLGSISSAPMSTTTKARKGRLPKIGRHSSGQARCTINGRVFYLGEFGSPESVAKFAELLRQHQDGDVPQVPHAGQMMTVAKLVDAYLAWIRGSGRYMKNGRPTSQHSVFGTALRSFVEHSGNRRLADLGEPVLLAWRDVVEQRHDLTRNGINRKVREVLRALRWAKSRGYMPAAAWSSCAALEPLRRGECGSRPEFGRKRRGVTLAEAERVAACCTHQGVGDAVLFQALTAARPGEVLALRWRDIDQTPVVVEGVTMWTLRVPEGQGKTAHLGRKITYPIAPRAQAILNRQPKGAPTAFVFTRRGTPIVYATYRHSILCACRRSGVPVFTPHELRHGALTAAAELHGVLVAQALAGHSSATVTARYLHTRTDSAYRVAAALG